MELIRKTESSSIEELERLILRNPEESEREFRLRVMNLLVPWSRGDFSKYYLQSDGEISDISYIFKSLGATRLMVVIYQFAVDTNQDFMVEFLATYDKNYLLAILEKVSDDHSLFLENFIFSLSRAIYRLDRIFYKRFESYFQGRQADNIVNEILSGVCYEAVLLDAISPDIARVGVNVPSDATETFDDINQDQGYRFMDVVAQASYEAKTTKYVFRLIDQVVSQYLVEQGRKTSTAYLEAIKNSSDIQSTSQVIKAISQYSTWPLVDILNLVLSSNVVNIPHIYGAFYFAGLSIDEIKNTVDSSGKPMTLIYAQWKNSLNMADV